MNTNIALLKEYAKDAAGRFRSKSRPWRWAAVILLVLALASGCAKAGGLVVNSAGDAGDSDPGDETCRTSASATECTLRAALEEANAWAGSDTITFNLPAGSLTISPASSLPQITESVILDGTSQSGYVRGSVMVILDGSTLPVSSTVDGLTIAAPDLTVTLKGFAIVEFPDCGISNRGRLTLEEMQVSRNRSVGLASGGGAAIPVLILNSEFADNGGAGISSTMNDFTISGGTIRGNRGGIGISSGSLVMADTEVRDNAGSTLFPWGGIGLYNSRANLTGVVIDNNTSHDTGGGIIFTSDGSHILTVADSTISGNRAFHGGGIDVNGGTVRLNRSTLIDNQAEIDGGAVRVLPGLSGTTTLWVENGTAIGQPGHGNAADIYPDSRYGIGGGIYSEANVEVNNSTVEANAGDGIYNKGGSLRLQNSTVRGNTGNGIGSSYIIGHTSIQISNSTIEANTLSGINASYADLYFIGSRILGNSEGGLQMDGGDLNLSYSTISGNTQITGGRVGGGIGLRSMGEVVIQNSTISGNYTPSNGGGLYIQARSGLVKNVTISGNRTGNTGGGLVAGGEAVTLNNVTITQNEGRFSGGILGDDRLTIRNSIVAANTPINCAPAEPFASEGNNLDDGTTCGFGAAGDLSGVPAVLGPLQDNGGSTFTHALLPGSPALDAGNDATCLALDQRNINRPQGPHCDIGAFELIPADATPTPTHTPLGPETVTPTPTTELADTLTPTLTRAAILFEQAIFSSDKLFQGGQSCNPKTIAVQVRVSPPELVKSVWLFYRIVEKNGNGSYPWSAGVNMPSQGDGWYELTLAGNDLPDIFIWQNEAWLDFQFVANDANGQMIAWSQLFRQVTFWQCYV